MNQLTALLQLPNAGAGMTAADVGARLNLSRSRAANLMRVARLGEPVVSWVASGRLTTKHGEQLLRLPPAKREALARSAMAARWSVAALAVAVDQALGLRVAGEGSRDPDIAALERRLGEILGTVVEVRHDGRSGAGVLAIQYTDADTMAGVLERLGWRED